MELSVEREIAVMEITIFDKRFILDIWQGFKYDFALNMLKVKRYMKALLSIFFYVFRDLFTPHK